MWWVQGLRRRLTDDRGVTAVEYGLILALVALVSLPALAFLRGALTTTNVDTQDSDNVVACAPADPTCNAYGTLPAANLGPGYTALSLSSYTPTTGAVDVPMTSTVTRTGGTAPYSYALTSGSLPGGLTLLGGSGAVTGTPTSPGSFPVTITVTDATGNSASTSPTFVISAAAVDLQAYSPLSGIAGQPFTSTPSYTGGASPLQFDAVGLPAGLSISATTGVITGTPAAGTSSVTVTVIDGNGSTDSLSITLSFGSTTPAPSLSGYAPLEWTVNSSSTASPSVTGGQAPLEYTVVAGSLPSGLVIDGTSGQISGTPSAAGSTNITVRVTDDLDQSDDLPITIVVNAAPALTTYSPLTGTVGAALSSTTTRTGGTAPFTFDISAGSLPSWLSLDPGNGALTGTPTASATSTFTVRVTDARGATATRAVTITISPAAPTYIDASSGRSGASSISVSTPATTEAGDLLVLGITVKDNVNNLNTPTGWTLQGGQTESSKVGVRIYYRYATAAGAATTTFTTNGRDTSWGVIVVRGAAASNPLSVQGDGASGGGANATMTAPTITPTQSNQLLISVFGSKKKSAAHSTPTGMSQRVNTSSDDDFRTSIATQALSSSAATGVRTAGSADGDPWVAYNVLVKAP